MKGKAKTALIVTLCAAVLAAFLLSPPAALIRSMAVMSVYSASETKKSLAAERGFKIKLPSGKGWYPFVMTFNGDSAFERLTGYEGARLTILYNFPDFDLRRGCSRLFDADSPYYNSFYGAYLTSLPDGRSYGLDPEGISLNDAAAAIAGLDFFGFVLGDFGLEASERVFDYTVLSETAVDEFCGIEDWVRADATLRVNGVSHESAPGIQSYWQYGKPRFPVVEPFAPVEMECTVLARFFDEWNTTVYFYVMASSSQVRDDCVEGVLSRSVLSSLD